MPSDSLTPVHQRSRASRIFTSTVRVLFTTLIFTAGGMAGVQPDMRNAYRHFAIPLAITVGTVAFLGALVLELRARRTRA